MRRTKQHNLRRCRDRAGRHRAIGDDVHSTMRAVSGFSGSLRQSGTSITIHRSQSLWPTRELCRPHKTYVTRRHFHLRNLRTYLRHNPNSILCPTRLPIEFGTFRPLHQPPATLSRHTFRRHPIWTTENRVAVVAYVDDVTIFVTQGDDFRIIREALQRYENATGAKNSEIKSSGDRRMERQGK